MHVRQFLCTLVLIVVASAVSGGSGRADIGYPNQIAGQLATAMDLSREEGKALEGVAVTVELELDTDGRIEKADIVAVQNAPDAAVRRAAVDALEDAFDHFRSDPFKDLDPGDHGTWGHMRLTFQLGLHVGGYQP